MNAQQIDRRRVAAIIRKDWTELRRNPQAVTPMLVVPALFTVVFPLAVILLGNTTVLTSSVNGMQQFLDNLPDGIVPAGYSTEQTVVHAVIVFFLAPLFLLIPVMVATISASSAFVGEKERRTLEGLLYTPATDTELVLAKVLASFLPATALAWVSFLVYTVLVNAAGWQLMGGWWFPNGTWLVLALLLAPLVSFLATALVVAVSGRSTTAQGAQGIATLMILPVVGMVVGQASGLMLFDLTVALALAAVLLVVDLVVFRVVVARFSRERILTRL